MVDIILLIISAFWLGILTSISPCPLATNITAISYISTIRTNTTKSNMQKNFFSTIHEYFFNLLPGMFYCVGRVVAYTLLSYLIVKGLVSMPQLSFYFQKYMHIILGPLLIIVGMFVTELISITFSFPTSLSKYQLMLNKHASNNLIGAFLLGLLFALTFCPVSAAIFFGGLIPMILKNNTIEFFALSYGIGTALPVMIFSFAIIAGSKITAKLFNQVTNIDKWMRSILGSIIILTGVYFCITYIFSIT